MISALEHRLLLAHVLGCTQEALVANPTPVLTPAQQNQLDALMARRTAHEPMAHILGEREFYGLSFKVTKDTLVPRPDTETLIEGIRDWALGMKGSGNPQSPIPNPHILDLGTGTGCLLITLLHLLPDATGLGVDISEAALAVAAENAARMGVAGRTQFQKSRWTAQIPAQTFEIIVANPPYIPSNTVTALMPDVALYEPQLALDGGADGLDAYRELSQQLTPFAAPRVLVGLEIGDGQSVAVRDIFQNKGWKWLETKKDLAGIDRALIFTN